MNWIGNAFASAVFAAATAILAKIGIQNLNSNLGTAIRTVVILIFAWGLVFADGSIRGLSSIPLSTFGFLVASGLTTGLSWIFYFRALQQGTASQVAPIDKLSLVLTIIFAALVLKEKLTLNVMMGAALMTAGAILITLSK